MFYSWKRHGPSPTLPGEFHLRGRKAIFTAEYAEEDRIGFL
jgi:hypothetical protein